MADSVILVLIDGRLRDPVLHLFADAGQAVAHAQRHLVVFLRQQLEEAVGFRGGRAGQLEQLRFGRVALGRPVVVELLHEATDLLCEFRVGLRRRDLVGRRAMTVISKPIAMQLPPS